MHRGVRFEGRKSVLILYEAMTEGMSRAEKMRFAYGTPWQIREIVELERFATRERQRIKYYENYKRRADRPFDYGVSMMKLREHRAWFQQYRDSVIQMRLEIEEDGTWKRWLRFAGDFLERSQRQA